MTPSMENAIRETERRREHSNRNITKSTVLFQKQLRKKYPRFWKFLLTKEEGNEKKEEKTSDRSRTQADDRTIDKRNEGSRQAA